MFSFLHGTFVKIYHRPDTVDISDLAKYLEEPSSPSAAETTTTIKTIRTTKTTATTSTSSPMHSLSMSIDDVDLDMDNSHNWKQSLQELLASFNMEFS